MSTSVAAGDAAMRRADDAQSRLDLDATIAHLSAAVRAFTADETPRQAAMACVRLGDVMANFLANLTAGRTWYARAERLVADLDPCVEQGWVAVAGMGCDAADPAVLLERADFALGIARRFGDLDLETKALADGGLAHVQAGRLDEGFAMLDEAMALACGPAGDDAASRSACSLFTACYYTSSFERAGTWADLLRRSGLIGPASGGPVFLHTHCTSLHGALLLEQGQWGEAERVLADADALFGAAMGGAAFHISAVMADLRILQGRVTEAEALLSGQEQAFEMLLPSARLELARGDSHLAAAIARRGLLALGASDRLRAIGLLEVLVAAELDRGDLDAARDALDELQQRHRGVGHVGALALRLAATSATVLEAAGAREQAIAVLDQAVSTTPASRAPWRSAVIRLELARLRAAAGDLGASRADLRIATSMVAALDIVLAPAHAGLVSGLVSGLAATDRGRTAGGDVATLVYDGAVWTACHGGMAVQLREAKGLRYLAELLARRGVEQHVIDLVDRLEGLDPDRSLDRRRLGDAGPALDSRARLAYRHRAEELRQDIDRALAAMELERAEALQDELDQLVGALAAAFGLGGRARVSTASERARLNVTRALRTAIGRVAASLPSAGADLDRSIRTGTYCRYDPPDGAIRWIVQSPVNGPAPD